MANALIDKLAGPFDPEKYADTYRDTLCEIIKAKREGETLRAPEVEKEPKVPDLMAALKASLEGASARGDGRSGNGKVDREALERLSKQELYERAKKADVPGRADMSKDELVEALAAS